MIIDPFDGELAKAMEKPMRALKAVGLVCVGGALGYGIYEIVRNGDIDMMYAVFGTVVFALLVGAVYLILGRKRK